MRWRAPLIFALAGSLALVPTLTRAASLQEQYLHIYLKINEADHAEQTGDIRTAYDDFKDCYARLVQIHNDNPDWETALVMQRIRDCKERLSSLEPKVDALPPVPPPGPPSTTPETTPPSTEPVSPSAVSNDVVALQKQLGEVQEELRVTKQALDDTTEKYQNSQLEVQSLRSQLDTVNQKLKDLNTQQPMNEQVGTLMTANKELTDKLAAAEDQIKSLSSNPSSSLALLRVQLKNAQDKLAESDAANKALQETTTSLQQQLAQAQNDLDAANQKLAAVPAGSPEYLTIKRENEVMRAILTREIQEQSRRDGAKRLAQEEFDRLKINSRVLQDELDILGTPMTPPTTDEERTLLESLKTSPMEIAAPPAESGNVLSASNAPATETNAATATAPAVTDTNAVATVTTPATAETNATTAVTPPATVPATETNQPPANVATTTAPTDTNAAANPAVPSTDTNAVASATNAPPATPAADTNTVATTTAPTTDTNAPTVTQLPPPTTSVTTTVTNTTISNNESAAAATTNAAPVASNNGAPATPPSSAPTTDTSSASYASQPNIPDDMRATAQQASDLFTMKRYDEAAAKYQTIIDKYPDSLYAWSNLGVVRFQQASSPDNTKDQQQEFLGDAMKALQQAVKLSPTDAFSYSNLGIVYYQLGQYDPAIDALERAIVMNPNNAQSHNYLGCACSQKGWQERAEHEFRKAIELDDTLTDAHYNLAICYVLQKPPALEMARRHYNRALELGMPKDPRLEKMLAEPQPPAPSPVGYQPSSP